MGRECWGDGEETQRDLGVGLNIVQGWYEVASVYCRCRGFFGRVASSPRQKLNSLSFSNRYSLRAANTTQSHLPPHRTAMAPLALSNTQSILNQTSRLISALHPVNRASRHR